MRVGVQRYQSYLLLLSVRFGAMTILFFLPTNRKFILELLTYRYIPNTQRSIEKLHLLNASFDKILLGYVTAVD
jgi:CRP-like cAMP-binding protein